MKFSVCIEMIFADRPFEDRIDAVAAAGFPAIEFWGWTDRNLDAIKARADKNGVNVACIVGSGVQIVDQSTHADFLKGVRHSCDAANKLGTSTIIVLSGNEITDRARQEQHDNIVKALKAAGPIAEDSGVMLALEPLNALVDHKGYFLNSSAEGYEIVNEVDCRAVGLLFDVYHQQITEGNVTSNLVAGVDRTCHVHIADVPGRMEPGTGELNYINILSALEKAGYQYYCGLEFLPSGNAEQVMTRLCDTLQAAGLM